MECHSPRVNFQKHTAVPLGIERLLVLKEGMLFIKEGNIECPESYECFFS